MIRNDHHKFLRYLREGRTDQRLREIPIEVNLDSYEYLPDVHPVSAGKPNLGCNLADDFTISKREAPEARDNPPEKSWNPYLMRVRPEKKKMRYFLQQSRKDGSCQPH